MPVKGRPPNKGGGNKPSNRGTFTPKPQPRSVRGKGTTHKGGSSGGGGTPPKKCCPMVEALVSVKRGNLRLARRYALMSVRLLLRGA